MRSSQQAELPLRKGFYRTPFDFYVADHKSPPNLTWPKTLEWIYRDGSILIPNSSWSRVATLTYEELNAIENPDIRKEAQEAQRLILEYPLQFVNLLVIGNKILIEPYGSGVKPLDRNLENRHIEVYDHDVSRIRLGRAQERYNYARLWVDESVQEGDIKVAVRGDKCEFCPMRLGVYFRCGFTDSSPHIAGIGFRPGKGNQAYFDSEAAMRELAEAGSY